VRKSLSTHNNSRSVEEACQAHRLLCSWCAQQRTKPWGRWFNSWGGGGDEFGQWLPDPVGDGDLITKETAHVDALPGRVVELLLQIPLAGRVREEGNRASGKPARPRPSLT
jgi:hypothetical protein